jgi:hypothetical protein
MNLYVSYNYLVDGEVRWGSVVLYSVSVGFPLSEPDIWTILHRVREHENLSNFWKVNLLYILPLA